MFKKPLLITMFSIFFLVCSMPSYADSYSSSNVLTPLNQTTGDNASDLQNDFSENNEPYAFNGSQNPDTQSGLFPRNTQSPQNQLGSDSNINLAADYFTKFAKLLPIVMWKKVQSFSKYGVRAIINDDPEVMPYQDAMMQAFTDGMKEIGLGLGEDMSKTNMTTQNR